LRVIYFTLISRMSSEKDAGPVTALNLGASDEDVNGEKRGGHSWQTRTGAIAMIALTLSCEYSIAK